MLKRALFALLVGASLSLGTVAHAREAGIVGVITKVDPNRLEIRGDSREAACVRLTAETTYLKWLMAKPPQQELRTDLRALRAGRRVHIEATAGPNPVAQTVWVVTGRPGFD